MTRRVTTNFQDELFSMELIAQNRNCQKPCLYYTNKTEHFVVDHSHKQRSSTERDQHDLYRRIRSKRGQLQKRQAVVKFWDKRLTTLV